MLRSVFQKPGDVPVVLSHPVGKDYELLCLARTGDSSSHRCGGSMAVGLERETRKGESHGWLEPLSSARKSKQYCKPGHCAGRHSAFDESL